MKIPKSLYIFLISFILLNLSLIYATNLNENNNKYFRLHIVANSDSIDDQLLKYNIAKKIDEYISSITQNCKNKNESKQIITENMQEILNICNELIKLNNKNYNVKAYLGKIEYGEKYMNNINMPAGTYDSLKIVIGDGNGQNWWTLISPINLSIPENADLFSAETTYSFKLVEIIANWLTKPTN